jgi:carbon-monoxide dehydrogenase large subunit
MLPDGTVDIYVGVQNHGQGHETTLSQIAAHELGIDPAQISVRYGDTGIGPYGFGTFASRSIVFAGGAVGRASRALAEKISRIGAHLLQADVAATRIEDGKVHGPSGSIGIAEIAFAANARPDHLPAGMTPLLDVTATYEPADSGGVFAYGTHAVVVAVDPDCGKVDLLKYVVSEDCGTMINPMIVDGQVVGGIAQGIGTALFEEIPYNADGQPLAASLADYLLPTADEMPFIQLEHLVTPALTTEYGVKGLGEGGAIAPPAAIANAVADAFADLRVSFDETPLTPRRIYETVARTRAKAAKA